jgi:dCTP deaminase
MMTCIQYLKNEVNDFLRPVLSDRNIMRYNKKGLLFETPIKSEQLQPNSVDLTLGKTWKILRPNVIKSVHINNAPTPMIDSRTPIEYGEGSFEHAVNGSHYYIIEPKQFVLMASNEILNIPNGIIAFVQGRSSIARLAIQTEQAGLIDAGFRGTITFEVFNQSDYPIILYEGTRVAQVYFFKAQHALCPYGEDKGSKYNGQIVATGSRIHLDQELRKE